MTTDQERWQVDVNGQIYEASFDDLVVWISESALHKNDMVRRGELRWLEAGKVPPLSRFFNAVESGDHSVFVSFTDSAQKAGGEPAINVGVVSEVDASDIFPGADPEETEVILVEPIADDEVEFEDQTAQPVNPNACYYHTEVSPEYVCDGCSNRFCRGCPNSYGGTVKTCKLCGGMCRDISKVIETEQRNYKFQSDLSRGFGVEDLGKALGYPFRFKTSLIFGGILFMLFTLGQTAGGFGLYMMVAAIFCLMLANALTFGILANTIENFSQAKTDLNFMPSFDEFDLWHDVVHPFFLSIGVYLISFGLLIAVIVGSVWYVISSITSVPGSPPATLAGQPAAPGEMQNPLLSGNAIVNPELAKNEHLLDEDEKQIMRLDGMINEHRKNQLESTIGPSPETRAAQNNILIDKLKGMALPFLVLGLLAALWGAFYFPAACIVAGYTRSFGAILNPMVGLDTIKRLGADYFKILVVSLGFAVLSLIVSGVFQVIFKVFDLPGMGNLPALALTSLVSFYFSIAFSVFLGLAIYKNSEKLIIFR